MRRLLSQLVTVIVLVCSVLLFPNHALAQSVPHKASGAAQFVSPNDFIGSGNATHLGKYTEVGNVAFTPTSSPTVLAVDGWSNYTAANGDELHALLHGELDASTGVITVTVSYVGGTGRFLHATGSSNLAGQLLGGGAAVIAVHGNIQY
jgi:hypothetical protein